MPTAHDLEMALSLTSDRSSFLKNLLIDGLQWPIPENGDSPEPGTSPDDWTARWAAAFDVEKVTKKFYEEYKGWRANS